MTSSINRLQYLCDTIPALLYAISDEDLSQPIAPGKWSRKQVIGHLIDSATNNHQRFVRGQFEDTPYISYDADNWVDHGYYQQMPGKQLINFWEAYNRQLLLLAMHIPAHLFSRTVNTGDELPHTLQWIIEDYVVHLEHHLEEIVDYQ